MAANEELRVLGKAYGIDETTDMSALEKKVLSFVTLHFIKVKGWIKSAESDWNTKKNYEKVGRDAATWVHEVLGNSLTDENKIAERIANEAFVFGAFDQNKKSNPATLNACASDANHV